LKKVLIITYYWPPSGGSGVQRWMYFSKYLSSYNIKPVVITVDDKMASYKHFDYSFIDKIKEIEVYKTKTVEPLKTYSKLISGNSNSGIPAGFAGENKPSIFQKISRYIRGNFFIPDARKGWVKYAYRKSLEVIKENDISLIISTGPPHSSHLVAKKLKENLNIKWIADFRDPWSDIFYNKYLFRTSASQKKDESLENEVLDEADLVLTVGPSLKEHLINRNNINKYKVKYIYNGYDQSVFDTAKSEKDRSYFTICHIGLLSDSQPITSFLVALKGICKKNHPICKKLRLKLIGNISPSIISEIENTLPNIELQIIDYLPHKDAIHHMVNSDLLLNSLAEMENSQLLVSGKLMEYIASGNPILCLGNPNGDAASLLKDIKYSDVFDRKDIDSIILFLNIVFDNWLNNKVLVLKNTYSQYSRKETTKQLAEIINTLI